MHACYRIRRITVKPDNPLLCPVIQSAYNILLGIIKPVRNIRYPCCKICAQHPEQIQIDLELGIICIGHVIINKTVGHNCKISSAILINPKVTHIYSPSHLLSFSDYIIYAT